MQLASATGNLRYHGFTTKIWWTSCSQYFQIHFLNRKPAYQDWKCTEFSSYGSKWQWLIIPPPNEVGGGVYWIHLVRPSVRPSVCRRHGFRSISQVSFGIFGSSKWLGGGIYTLLRNDQKKNCGRFFIILGRLSMKKISACWNFSSFESFCSGILIRVWYIISENNLIQAIS